MYIYIYIYIQTFISDGVYLARRKNTVLMRTSDEVQNEVERMRRVRMMMMMMMMMRRIIIVIIITVTDIIMMMGIVMVMIMRVKRFIPIHIGSFLFSGFRRSKSAIILDQGWALSSKSVILSVLRPELRFDKVLIDNMCA